MNQKKGDLAIFWDDDPSDALASIYMCDMGEGKHYRHKDWSENVWRNAVKFESKEQYE